MTRDWTDKALIGGGCLGVVVILAATVAALAGWTTHVVWLFHQNEAWSIVLGLFGVIFVPVGIVHGIYLWF